MKNIRILNENGATAVEFAVVLPLLLLVIFAIIEFSVVMYNKAMITDASRNGARTGVMYRWPEPVPESEIREIVENHLQERLITFANDASDLPIIRINGAGGSKGDLLTIEVDYAHRFLILPGFAAAFFGGGNGVNGSLQLSARAIMRME